MYSVILYFNSVIFYFNIVSINNILILFSSILFIYFTHILRNFYFDANTRTVIRHRPNCRSFELPRGSVPPTCTHMIVRGRRTQSPRREGERARRGGEGKGVGEAAGLLPLVQADGTKSIMYKDVKRNGSEMLFSGPTVSG